MLVQDCTPESREWAVGNDVVALSAFQVSCTPQFIRRVFTREELDYCAQFSDPMLRYASTWAAKEAVYKALKQIDGNIRLWWRDIEISRDKPSGKPSVTIKKLPFSLQCSLTLSHDGDVVWAVAVVRCSKK
ncbi:MAG: holo-ACP synthase [Phycisphaerae bacterium]|nr:holo-ACP synthase [Saprospiraceae bacterium]